MTRKEKIQVMKQQTKAKSSTAKPANKAKSVNPEGHEHKMREELKIATEKNAELQDKYLRLSAEFDNYRKRTHREKTELIKTASDDVL
jgi:molecular chaperone GrpE